MKTIKLESGVEIPKEDRQAYPWKEMKVGQSFFMPGKKGTRARMAAYIWGTRNGAKFKTVSVTEGGKKGARIWRTK